MRRPVPAAFATLSVAIAVFAGTAHADGVYFSENIGGTNVKDELAAYMDGGLRIRGALGYRHRNLAFEVWGSASISSDGYDRHDGQAAPCVPDSYCHGYGSSPHYGPPSTDFASWGMDVKYLQPVASHVEIYLRGGLSKGYAYGIDASGRGLGVGAGVQLKGKVPVIGLLFWPLFFTGVGPKMTGALFIDSSYEFYRLHGPARTTDAQLSHLTLGFAFGSDF